MEAVGNWKIALDDGTVEELDNPYGAERRFTRPGAYDVVVILSPINQRIQVLSYEGPDLQAMCETLRDVALTNNYGKVWVKAHAEDAAAFEDAGFIREAYIPRYFDGGDAHIYSYFVLEQRTVRPFLPQEDDILDRATDGTVPDKFRPLPQGYTTSFFTDADAAELAALYGKVFPTYPYPINNPDYLIE